MTKKTLLQIIDFLDNTSFRICILGEDFLSYGKKDGRSNRGWLVKGVLDHRIKRFPEGFFEKYKISDTAIAGYDKDGFGQGFYPIYKKKVIDSDGQQREIETMGFLQKKIYRK